MLWNGTHLLSVVHQVGFLHLEVRRMCTISISPRSYIPCTIVLLQVSTSWTALSVCRGGVCMRTSLSLSHISLSPCVCVCVSVCVCVCVCVCKGCSQAAQGGVMLCLSRDCKREAIILALLPPQSSSQTMIEDLVVSILYVDIDCPNRETSSISQVENVGVLCFLQFNLQEPVGNVKTLW
jgi:hypothetical protein